MAGFLKTFMRQMSKLVSAHVEPSTRVLQVTWDGPEHAGRLGMFPVIWLRDSCLCEECFHSNSNMKLIHMRDVDVGISPTNVKITDSKSSLHITWPKDHVSVFESDWLMSRDFGPHGHQFRRPNNSPLKLPVKFWGAEMKDEMKSFDYSDFIQSDRVLYDWLCTIEEVGIAVIRSAPKDSEVLKRIAGRVAFLKTTNFGQQFRVENKDNASNPAFTALELPMHTDLPYYEYVPGVQMLHCEIQAKEHDAGMNVFADGFRAAEELRLEDPETYTTLATVPIDYRTKADDFLKFDMHFRRPVIELEPDGTIASLAYHYGSRDSLSHVPLDKVQPLYEGLIKLAAKFYDPRNLIEIKLKQGDVMCFDNKRVLHGRKGYTVTPHSGTTRLLHGAYIDWDEMRSRRRVLETDLDM